MYKQYPKAINRKTVCSGCVSVNVVRLHECFRLFWIQHVYWTRLAIISLTLDLPDTEVTSDRLLRNASDTSRLFSRFYGARIAAVVKHLLTEHIVIAADLIKAAKAGDDQTATAAESRWHANGDEIAAFLHSINACWKLEELRAMWYEHLALIKEAVLTRLDGDYRQDIKIFNQIEKQALMMADEFSRGIVCQFRF